MEDGIPPAVYLTHLAVYLLEAGETELPIVRIDLGLRIIGGHQQLQQLRLG